MTRGGLGAMVAAVGVRPGLWPTALAQLFRLASPDWWHRRPFLPWPDPDYLHFRLETMYGGDGSGDFPPQDLVAYLRWCKAFRSG